MPIYCGPQCEKTGPLCDFCVYFNFNADSKGRYTGNGVCQFHKRKADPIEGCKDFQCFETYRLSGE